MYRAVAAVITTAILLAACSGGSDSNSPETSPTSVETSAPATETIDTEPAATDGTTAPETTPAPTDAPTTTIDEAAILAEAEAAYLEAFQVGKEALRNPDNPDNEALLEAHYTGPNLETAMENLRLTLDGNFIAVENTENPSFAQVVGVPEFVDGDQGTVRMAVCEFNSDMIFERGTAPDGGDALRRDDPVSILFVTRMRFEAGVWKSLEGGEQTEVRDEVEQCSNVS